MFAKKLINAGLLTTATVIFSVNSVNAQNYDDVFVFSDSLSDIGNAFNAFVNSGQTPVPFSPPYFNGRFSNGLVWSENLSQSLGITPNPNNNYAFGGSQTGISNLYQPVEFGVDSSIIVPGLLGQVNNYANGGNVPEDNDLFLIWIGANDYLVGDFSTPESTQQLITNVVTNTTNAVATLNSLGANNIAVANLPNLGIIPATVNETFAPLLTNLTIANNNALDSSLNNLQLVLGNDLNLIKLDMFGLFQDIVTNPQKYDLTNVDTSCLSTNCPNPEQYFFWDNLHPTAKGHEIIADFALNSVLSASTSTPEPNMLGTLSFIGLIGLAKMIFRN
jgi:phospholipase/lecithinase/hemolysin